MNPGSPVLITLFLAQADPRVAAELQQMGTALIIIAVAAVLFGLMCIGVLIAGFRLMRAITKLTDKLEHQIDQLSPRAAPLIDRVTAVATDAHDVTDNVRRRVGELMDTISDLNHSIREASHAAEVRIREFAAVLDVVKEETEELLMDTAATARGLHRTAEALRASPPSSRRALRRAASNADAVVRRARPKPQTPVAAPVVGPGDDAEGPTP